ncbi:MAG: NHL repeat-containing protein, partial [Chloroflexota bacterium]|nr:NHL repeat-containing protein [Chloroflexota bacterium]
VNNRFVQWTSAGTIIRACGQRGFTSAGDFNWPRGLAVDPTSGEIWIADTKQSDIQIIKADCTPVAQFGTLGTGLANFNWPYSVAIRHSDGIAWIADTVNNRVVSYKVSTRTAISSFPGLSQPGAVAVAPANGHLYVVNSKANTVVELSDTAGSSITLVRTLTGGFSKPLGVTVDALGHIYVADSGNSRVVVLNSDGTQAGIITGGFNHPEDLSIAPNGNLLISDTYNDKILRYSVTF